MYQLGGYYQDLRCLISITPQQPMGTGPWKKYTRCIQAVTLGVFPQKALQDQKKWMRHFLNKPRDMPVQDYIAQVIKINNYLAEFPPTIVGRNAVKVPDDKLLDLL